MIRRLLRAKWFPALALVLVVATGAGLYWFQPWKLVTEREVQEALPAVVVPDRSAVPAPSSTAGAPTAVPAPAGDRLLAAGTFVTHEHETTGAVQLVELAGGRRQLVLRDLATSNGPDLRVWLTDREVVSGTAGWKVFDDGRWVELARLKGNRGNQVYDIPAAVDLTDLRSVSIWCRRFSVSFGAAPLTPA